MNEAENFVPSRASISEDTLQFGDLDNMNQGISAVKPCSTLRIRSKGRRKRNAICRNKQLIPAWSNEINLQHNHVYLGT
jgi:hypothetical protein